MAARRATSSVNWAALGARMTGPGQKAVFTVSKIYHVSRNLYLPTNEWQPEKSCLINELGSHDDFAKNNMTVNREEVAQEERKTMKC